MATSVDACLEDFESDDLTFKVCQAVISVIPAVPDLHHYESVKTAMAIVAPEASEAVIERAVELSRQTRCHDAMRIAQFMDSGDRLSALYRGIQAAVMYFTGKRSEALNTEEQQGKDAALKFLALGAMVSLLFDGTDDDKADAFRNLPAGKAIAIYFAAVEVGLPFSDQVLASDNGYLRTLMEEHGKSQASRLDDVADDERLAAAKAMVERMMNPMDTVAHYAVRYVEPIARSAGMLLPGSLDKAGEFADVAAVGVDVIPSYRLLAARLAAEACISRAVAEQAPIP
ncbi:hypothetical protein HQ535_15505 [bacterium]|nr:hypothetical protein [bacterium]